MITPMKRRRIIVNNDFYNIFQSAPPITDQDIYDAVDRMAGTQVDTLFLMVPDGLEGGCLDDDLIRLYDHPDTDQSINVLRDFQRAAKTPSAWCSSGRGRWGWSSSPPSA